MAALTGVPGRGMGPLPQAAPRDAALPRPRSRAFGRVLRGVSLLLSLAVLLALAAAGSLQVLQSSRTATAGYELRALQNQRNELAARVRLLEADIARMANLDEVHAAATGRLGMAPPERTLRATVSVTAPATIPMPERYVQRAPVPPADPAPWWARLLGGVPGFD